MRKTRIDKAIGAIFPGWAEARAISRHNLSVLDSILTGGYKGGKSTRRRNSVSNGSQREDTRGNSYDKIISAAMNLYRNDPLTRSIVDVVTAYMGEARPMATTSNAEWNAEATDYFNNYFWNIADARRRPGVDYGMLQQLWTRFTWVGGDMLFLLLSDGLYPYEGLQIQTPRKLYMDKNITNGVRIQPNSPHRITHYYIVDTTKSVFNAEFSRINYRNAIFAPSKIWRPAMLRGVPELHAVVDALQDFEETSGNVQSKIKFESQLFTVERKGAVSSLPGRAVLSTGTDGEQVETTKVDYGMRFKVDGSPREDFLLSDMNNPGTQHVPYMQWMARIISAGVGLPYDIVLHLYESSYTASRAARCDFKRLIIDRWSWRNKVLNQRVWNWAIAKAVKNGEISTAPVDNSGRSEWYKCSWTLPHFDQIDENKESMSRVRKWRTATISLADIASEQQRTRGQLLDAHDEDIREIKSRAASLGVTLEEYAGELFKEKRINAAPEK